MEILKKDQIFELLSSKITSGEYPPGFRFPTELQFSRELGVAKVTLRSALARLEQLGMVERKVSQGTFVPKHFVPMGKRFVVIQPSFPDISNPYHYIMPGIERRSMEKKVELVRTSYEYAGSPSFFQETQCSGIIILGCCFTGTEPILNAVREAGLPAVIVGRNTDHKATQLPVIATDNHNAWLSGLNYLKKRKFKKIATLWYNSGELHTRINGDYAQLLHEIGLEEAVPLVFSAQYNAQSIRDTVDKILELPQLPEVIIGYSDFFALIIMEHLKARKIKVPGDIAVMGCCGYPGSAFLETPLSTIDFQYEKKGARAVDLLLEANRWFHSKDTVSGEYIPAVIIERASTIRKK